MSRRSSSISEFQPRTPPRRTRRRPGKLRFMVAVVVGPFAGSVRDGHPHQSGRRDQLAGLRSRETPARGSRGRPIRARTTSAGPSAGRLVAYALLVTTALVSEDEGASTEATDMPSAREPSSHTERRIVPICRPKSDTTRGP